MDRQELIRVGRIYNSLERKFNENQKEIEPTINRLSLESQLTTKTVLKIYKNYCQASLDELEKYATLSEDIHLQVKRKEDSENAFKSYIGLLNCLKRNDKDYELATKKLEESSKNLAIDYDDCMLTCTKESANKTNEEISDCFIKCNIEFVDVYKKVSSSLADEFLELREKLNKL